MGRQLKDFLTYYNAFFGKVYRYIFFRVGKNRELAEDLTSEIFIKALENFDSFDEDIRPFPVWIYRIAHNHLADHYKKSKREIVPIEEVENEIKIPSTVAKDLDITLGLEKVKTALEELPAMQKDVVILKYFNDLSNPEIAQILQTTEAHIRVIQFRAIQTLKSRLSFVTS